jgi:hypothetical protein
MLKISKMDRVRVILASILMALGIHQLADCIEPLANSVPQGDDQDLRKQAQGSNGWGVD